MPKMPADDDIEGMNKILQKATKGTISLTQEERDELEKKVMKALGAQ